jgi:transcriptional regulator of acetoin/glycerol metabolism
MATDPRFDPTFDLASGFRTRNILATPVVDSEGEIIAVLQCINKQRAQFSREDEILIQVRHYIMVLNSFIRFIN